MAYITGLVTPEERAELLDRGWDLEACPPSLIAEDADPADYATVWVDASMFDIMRGPDWDVSTGKKRCV
jgi:hypothetical protein